MKPTDCRELQEKWMGEPWHEQTKGASFHSPASCSCGLVFEDNWGLATHIQESNRKCVGRYFKKGKAKP